MKNILSFENNEGILHLFLNYNTLIKPVQYSN